MCEWRTIPGFSKYKICTDGKIIGPRGHVLKQYKDKAGRLNVCISRDSKTFRTELVHRLLAMAFIRVPVKGEVVRHLNDIPSDNRLENLVIGTPQDNADDRASNHPSRYNGKRSKAGQVNHKQKQIIKSWLNKKSVEMYREGGKTLKQVGNIFGVDAATILYRVRKFMNTPKRKSSHA